MSPHQTSTKLARIARWALFGAVGLMGIALVATVYSTNRGIANASDTLIRGQSTVFGGLMRRLGREPTTATELETILGQHAPDGLRYIAILGADGTIEHEVGDAPADRSNLLVAGERFHLHRVGDRMRMQSVGGPPRPGSERRHRVGAVVLEFVPEIANDLRADARRSLLFAAVAGVFLLFVAIVLVRWFLRQEALERQLADGRRLAALGEMSATLAHEIRNPIASLKGNAQLLARMLEAEGGKPKSKADRVVAESIRLEKLTNDLLEFARTGAISRRPTDPGAVLREVTSRLSAGAIDIDMDGAPASWSLDERRLSQVLDNLIDNAMSANPAGEPPIRVAITATRDVLTITVRDHGEGVAADKRDAIFTPFYTDKTQGTGLGLAVSRRIARLHGGDITVSDGDGGGAVFTVTIPGDG